MSALPTPSPLLTIPPLLVALIALGCGEHKPTEPQQRADTTVASLTLTRDSATLEIGDGVIVRAEARTSGGTWLPKAAITWTSDADSVATVSTGTITAVGPGTARISARAGTASAAVAVLVPPRITAVSLAPKVDTLVDLTTYAYVAVAGTAAGRPGEGRYTVANRNPLFVQAGYDVGRHALALRALRRSTSTIVVTEAGGASDSMTAVVNLPTAQIALPTTRVGLPGRSENAGYTAFDANGDIVPDPRLTWRSSDTSVVAVDSNGVYTYRKVGIATVTVSSSVGATAHEYIRVDSTPHLVFKPDSVAVGMGMYDSVGLGTLGMLTPVAALRTADTSVAVIPDSVSLYSGWIRVTARKPGTTLVVATSPGNIPDTLRVRVVPSKLQIPRPLIPSRIVPGQLLLVGVAILDSLGRDLPRLANTTVTITSRDTSVLRSTDPMDTLVMYAPSGTSGQINMRGVASGSSWVVATAPGLPADSMLFTVTSLPRVSFIPGHRFIIGAGERIGGPYPGPSLSTTTNYYSIGNTVQSVTLRLSNRRPALATVPDSLVVLATSSYMPFDVTGLAPGVDTLIASAPGYDPDTLELVVTPLRIFADFVGSSLTVPSGGYVWITVGDTAGTQHLPALDIPLIVSSSNTAIAVPPSVSPLSAGWPGNWTIALGARDTGRVVITVRDTLGLGTPLAMPVTLVLDTSYAWVSFPPMALGFRQRGGDYLERVTLPWPGGQLQLTSSDTTIVTAPSSVAYPSNLDAWGVTLVGGTRPGSATVTASAPGYRPAPFVITVGAPRFKISANGALRTGTRTRILVGLHDPQGELRITDEDVRVSLSAPEGGLQFDSTTLTIPAGSSYDSTYVLVIGAGQRKIVASDRRGLSYAYLPDTLVTSVPLAQLRFGTTGASSTIPAVAAGLVDSIQVSRTPPLDGPLAVTIRCLDAEILCPGVVTIPAGAEWAYARVVGLQLGEDTIVATAPNYNGDTTRVEVAAGYVAVQGLPPQLKSGDSVGVTLTLSNVQFLPRPASGPLTFTLAASGLAISDGASGITTVTVPAGAVSSPVFYVRALAAGPAALAVENLLFQPYTTTATVMAAETSGGP